MGKNNLPEVKKKKGEFRVSQGVFRVFSGIVREFQGAFQGVFPHPLCGSPWTLPRKEGCSRVFQSSGANFKGKGDKWTLQKHRFGRQLL